MGQLWFGAFLGILLLIAKMCGFWLLTGGPNPEKYKIPYWLIFGKWTPIRYRIKQSTFLLFLVDLLTGYLGLHALALFGGNMVGGVAMATFSIACMVSLMWQFFKRWALNKWRNLFPCKQVYYIPKKRGVSW